ncbi:MFS transporter [Nocardioides sp. NPDC101246]|uniref:MFS transporter n=1 Tax=Nocardioides sp. NPDC101246 TaxID=3364336 RepID=UPI00380C147F
MTTAEPTSRSVAEVPQVGRLGGLLAAYFGVQLFVNVTNGAVVNSLIPNLIVQLAPQDKVAILGGVGAIGAVAALVAQPIWGLLSDRTRSRWGRRAPWVLGGVVGLSASFLGLTAAGSVALVLVVAGLIALFYAMVAAPLAAVVPDRTPESRRGVFSALGSLGVFVGALIGIVFASAFVDALSTGFAVMAAVVLIGGVPFALWLRERPADDPEHASATVGRVSITETLKSFVISPREHPDFYWAFVARLVLMVGYWSIVSFQLYILDDYIGLGLERANQLFPVTTTILFLGIIVAVVPSGMISDRIGRRKPFVVVSSIIVAASTIVPILWPTVTGALVSVAVGGLGVGIYFAVDQALMTQVLPDATSAGKDLGVLNIAQAGGQVLAPLVASLVIGLSGYAALYAVSTVMAVLAAFAILPIRSVR